MSGQRHAPAALLPPGRGPPVPILQEAGWAPEPVWTKRLEEKSFRLCRGSNLDRPAVQSVARHYTDLSYLGSVEVCSYSCSSEDAVTAQP
jgi:hypothetical protein